MIFWDASTVVPLCLYEPWTPLLTQVVVGQHGRVLVRLRAPAARRHLRYE
jgi:hypothetical protein